MKHSISPVLHHSSRLSFLKWKRRLKPECVRFKAGCGVSWWLLSTCGWVGCRWPPASWGGCRAAGRAHPGEPGGSDPTAPSPSPDPPCQHRTSDLRGAWASRSRTRRWRRCLRGLRLFPPPGSGSPRWSGRTGSAPAPPAGRHVARPGLAGRGIPLESCAAMGQTWTHGHQVCHKGTIPGLFFGQSAPARRAGLPGGCTCGPVGF